MTRWRVDDASSRRWRVHDVSTALRGWLEVWACWPCFPMLACIMLFNSVVCCFSFIACIMMCNSAACRYLISAVRRYMFEHATWLLAVVIQRFACLQLSFSGSPLHVWACHMIACRCHSAVHRYTCVLRFVCLQKLYAAVFGFDYSGCVLATMPSELPRALLARSPVGLSPRISELLA